jgi:hypothetical protein
LADVSKQRVLTSGELIYRVAGHMKKKGCSSKWKNLKRAEINEKIKKYVSKIMQNYME